MAKIKICGLSRLCDIDYVNHAQPDFCGFVIDVPGSRRNVSPETVRALRNNLRPEIQPVGVFVDAPIPLIAGLVRDKTLSIVQLHGHEDEGYMAKLRREIAVPIIKAFSVSGPADVKQAEQSSAEFILLDNGGGGTGQTFDWSCLTELSRPYILSGGLTPENLEHAIRTCRPWAVDLSSGAETDGVKDRDKILAAVRAARRAEIQPAIG